jgi:hypothetical protein
MELVVPALNPMLSRLFVFLVRPLSGDGQMTVVDGDLNVTLLKSRFGGEDKLVFGFRYIRSRSPQITCGALDFRETVIEETIHQGIDSTPLQHGVVFY